MISTDNLQDQSQHGRGERPRFRLFDRHVLTIVTALLVGMGAFWFGVSWAGQPVGLGMTDVIRGIIAVVAIIALERLLFLIQLRMRGSWIDVDHVIAEHEFERDLAEVQRALPKTSDTTQIAADRG